MERDDAVLLLDQAKDLLKDERAFGDKLVNDRKIKLSLVALLVGFGFFNIDSATSIVHLASEVGMHEVVIGVAILGLVVLLILSIYWLVLENDPKFIRSLLNDIKSDGNEQDHYGSIVDTDDPKKIFGAALVVLYPDELVVNSVEESGFGDVASRIADYQTAYVRLATANRRVRRRLEYGTIVLLLAFVSVILLSGIVVWMSQSADTENRNQQHRCLEGVGHERRYPN